MVANSGKKTARRKPSSKSQTRPAMNEKMVDQSCATRGVAIPPPTTLIRETNSELRIVIKKSTALQVAEWVRTTEPIVAAKSIGVTDTAAGKLATGSSSSSSSAKASKADKRRSRRQKTGSELLKANHRAEENGHSNLEDVKVSKGSKKKVQRTPKKKTISTILPDGPHGAGDTSLSETNVAAKVKEGGSGDAGKDSLWPSYWPRKRVDTAIAKKDPSILVGVLRLNSKNPAHAYLTVEGEADDILIPSKLYQNRALNGDEVVVQLMRDAQLEKERHYQSKLQKQAERRLAKRIKSVSNGAASEFTLATKSKREYRFGRVVFVLQRYYHHKFVSGKISTNSKLVEPGGDEMYVAFCPSDPSLPPLKIPKDQLPSTCTLKNSKADIWTASFVDWYVNDKYPVGRLGSKIGRTGDIKVESEAILQDNCCNWKDFPQEALDCLPQVPWKIPPEEVQRRRDFRKHRIFSIDPATAKDLDDAVSVVRLGEDEFELGVHIADVSFFVNAHSALDKEAAKRATTVYLVERAVPMLPRLLCEELCSLNPGVDRFSFSVVWRVDGEGRVLGQGEPWFGQGIIRSCAKLSYDHAQAVIEGHTWEASGLPECEIHNGFTLDELEGDIRVLYRMTRAMRARRFRGGALSMQSIKLWFAIDSNTAAPTDCGVYQQKEANKLIEELMLMANMAVATKLSNNSQQGALLRRHSPPNERSLQVFCENAVLLGYSFDTSSAGAFQRSFDRIENPLHRYVLRLLAIKPMQRANYYCYSSEDTNGNHYALSVPLYTHFTSPIRRYCDLVVHRHLAKVLSNLEPDHDPPTLAAIAKVCNQNKYQAKNAQDASSLWYLCIYMSSLCASLGVSEVVAMGVVFGVKQTRYEVLVPSYGIEQSVDVEEMIKSGFATSASFDAEKHQLLVKCDGRNKANGKANGKINGKINGDERDISEIFQKKLSLSCDNERGASDFTIGVFSVLPVRIRVIKDARPFKIKLGGMHPDLNLFEPQSAILERELYLEKKLSDGIHMGVFSSMECASEVKGELKVTSCPGMLADGD